MKTIIALIIIVCCFGCNYCYKYRCCSSNCNEEFIYAVTEDVALVRGLSGYGKVRILYGHRYIFACEEHGNAWGLAKIFKGDNDTDNTIRFGNAITIYKTEPWGPIIYKPECEVCEKESKKYSVTSSGSMSTSLATREWWDKDGNYHFDNPNTITTSYKCSNGHSWEESN